MLIKKIKLSNFKSFDKVEVELNDFNVLVGANASGKSNFLQALKFLKDIQEHGLENAISLQGGMEYLRNIKANSEDKVKIQVEFSTNGIFYVDHVPREGGISLYFKCTSILYNLAIPPDNNDILDEEIDFRIDITETKLDSDNEKCLGKYTTKLKKYGSSISSSFSESVVNVKLSNGKKVDIDTSLAKQKNSILFSGNFEANSNALLLEIYDSVLPFSTRQFSVYDFDIKKVKNLVFPFGKAELEGTGENLALVLSKILVDTSKKREFTNLISNVFPHIKGMEIEKSYNKSLSLKVKESYYERTIPDALLSNGTISITMMIVALFFENKILAVFEEPEHGIHPALIAKLMQLFYEASQDKQIIITTHNPEVVKHTQLKDLLLVSRQENGSSTISRPDNSQAVHTFLDNELGIDELFTQNLLDV